MTSQHQAPMPAQFNFNDFVKVRLTDYGRDVLAMKMNSRTSTPETDADGYTKFQLWELMNVFGEHLCNGRPVPFNPNIIFPAVSDPVTTNQHRATDEAWNKADWYDSCLLELRDRIQQLEASQKPSPSADKMLALQDQIRDGALTLADALKDINSETTIRTMLSSGLPAISDPFIRNLPKSNVHANFTGPQTGIEESLAIPLPLSLVGRVAKSIYHYDDSIPGPNQHKARAAIREVAAWLRSESPLVSGNAASWASLLEREANR